jgi:uncharacterized protein (DUF1778 family)
MSDNAETRSERVCLRMTPAIKGTLQQAAAMKNKSLGGFLLESGLSAAIDALDDRRVFKLDQGRWNAFIAALESPPRDNEALHKMLARKPAWEE